MKLHLFFVPHKHNNYQAFFLKSPVLLLLALALFALNNNFFLTPKSAPLPPSESKQVLGIGSNIVKEEIIRLTNEQRAAAGLSPVSENSTLSWAATLKAQDMISKNYWAHNSPEGKSPWSFINEAGYSYSLAGENLAKNFNDSSQVVSAWMASQGHKDNILNGGYSEIGIAIMNGTMQGEETTLVVQMFGTPVGHAKVLPAIKPAVAQAKPTVKPVVPSPSPTPVVSPSPSISPSPQAVVTAQVVAPSPQAVVTAQVVAPSPPPVHSTLLINAIALSTNQKITLLILFFILNLFIIDSVVLSSRRIIRTSSGHTMFHILVLGMVLIAFLIIKQGVII